MRDITINDKPPFKAILTGIRGIENTFTKKEYEVTQVYYFWHYLYVRIINDKGELSDLRAHRFKIK